MARFAAAIIVFAAYAGTGAIAAPATSPTTAKVASARPADTRHPAVQAGIADLTKQAVSALQRGEDLPRAQCDFFSAVVAAEIPPAAITAALRRPISNDPRVAAYVKWQLLSGLTSPVDEQTEAALLEAYRAAPPPLPRPGIDAQQREELERMIRKAKEQDADALSDRFEQIVERVERDNGPILRYRDALFARLPGGYGRLVAGWEDVAVRLDVGADAAAHARTVCKALPEWATQAPPEQLKAVLSAVRQLERKKGQEFYTRLNWSESRAKLQWSKSRGSLASVSQLDEAREFLEDQIRNPDVPLKFKDER